MAQRDGGPDAPAAMDITSTVDAYLQLRDVPESDRLAAWIERYEATHPEIFETYYRAWGRRDRRSAAAGQVDQLAPLIVQRERRARALVAAVARDFTASGLMRGPGDMRAVLLVGGHSSNGWVTDLEGRPTLFLALEFLGDAPYDDILVVHESVHLAYHQRGNLEEPETLAGRMFDEGLAVAASRHLRPGHESTAYFWFDGDHPDWADECRARADVIRRWIGSDLRSADQATIRDYFSLAGDERLPPRCGYWLGDDIVSSILAGGASIAELAGWDGDQIRSAIADALR